MSRHLVSSIRHGEDRFTGAALPREAFIDPVEDDAAAGTGQ
jgi:hypothetical protein